MENGQKVCKILNKKKYKNYLKGVYIELSEGPDNTEEYQNRGHEILSRVMECMDNENKENTLSFVTCPFCLGLCSYDNVCKNLQLLSEGICCRYYLPIYYSIEETEARSKFYRFAHVFLIFRLYMVCVIVRIIFGYNTNTIQIFGLYTHNMKGKQNSTDLDYHSSCNDLLYFFFFFFFLTIVMVQCVVECVFKKLQLVS